MAIVLAIQKWRPYLLGRLKYLLEQRMMVSEHQKWLTKILGYDFEIHYKPGLENKAADALSRVQEDVLLIAISVPSVISIPDLRAHLASDPLLSKIIQDLRAGKECRGYSLFQDCLKFKWRLVLPASSPLIPILLQEYHGNPLGTHCC